MPFVLLSMSTPCVSMNISTARSSRVPELERNNVYVAGTSSESIIITALVRGVIGRTENPWATVVCA